MVAAFFLSVLNTLGDEDFRPPIIAVFNETGFLNYLGWQALSPSRIASLLEEAGFKSELLNVEEIGDANRLSPTKYAAVVLPYGNAFPIDAYPVLKKYHESGGVFILSGIPFSHPTILVDGKWMSRGGESLFRHDGKGIGTGGFGEPTESGHLRVAAPGFAPNPLGLTDEDLSGLQHRRYQHLDITTLPKEDTVTPLIEWIDSETGKSYPVAAIIKHGCPQFHDSIDVWCGSIASDLDESNQFLSCQLLLRGIALALQMKESMPPARVSRILEFAGSLRRPSSLPGNLPYFAPPDRKTFVPKSPAPANHLLAVDISNLSASERIALACLQALSSRRQPRLWLNFNSEDRFWLNQHVQKGYIQSYEIISDWKALFKLFSDDIKGAIIPDGQLYRGDIHAVNIAACEDLIVCTPQIAKELKLPIKIDLRKKFKTFPEGISWIWDTYKDRLNHSMASYTTSEDLGTAAFAYEMQWRAPLLWIAGPLASERPGADPIEERKVVAKILSEMDPVCPVLGFPDHGEGGVGIGEPPGVDLISRYGKALVCTNYLRNTCVTSGISLDKTKSTPTLSKSIKFDPNKIYIALALSDGDNQHLWNKLWQARYFNHPRFGEFPLAFGIGPPIIDLQPAVVEWYYSKATPNTEFIADVSGVGYIHPDNFGASYVDSRIIMDAFLAWTNRYMSRLDLKSVRTLSGGDKILVQYLQQLPSAQSIFADMGRYSGREGIGNLTYQLDNKPVFRSVTSWRRGSAADFLQEIRDQAGKRRPAFVNGFIHCWTYPTFDKVAAIYDSRDADMVFVTPSQLAEIYIQSHTRKSERTGQP
ncbi:MAG: hypothetical protein J0I10_03650 [Verrucomicrobia bacterium]|nr:hypothetical protein [Verrucomicrobiota bacterium]